MSEQYDSLNAKTKLVDLASKYTDGDIENAKAMAAGQYNDIKVIKGKFLFPTLSCSGMFMIFINIIKGYITSVVNIATSKTVLFDKVRIFDDWKVLYGDLNDFSQGSDILDSSELSEYLLDSGTKYDLFQYIKDKNLDDLTKKISEVIKTCYDTMELQIQIDLDTCSSLSLELAGIDVKVSKSNDAVDDNQQIGVAEETPEESKIKNIEKEAKYIVSGTIIVSPVSGKYINDVALGEVINVLLIGKDPLTQKLISVLNAERDDGTIAPVKGRLKAKIPLEKNGYLLYALVAKGVLAKIVEEENVKIQMDSISKQDDQKKQSGNKTLIIIAVLAVLIILAVLLLIRLL